MAIPSWTPPTVFDLTNPYSSTLTFNEQSDRLYLLDEQQCSFDITVRATKSDVPQADGSILHHRFLTGVEMTLVIQLWQTANRPACDSLLREMHDDVMGSFRSLLNAEDNQGRLAWNIDGGNERMVDDLRLLVYPAYRKTDPLGIVTVTVDSQFPYAQDLNQTRTSCADGVPETLTNTGSSSYQPVFLVNMFNTVIGGSAVHDFTITLTQGPNSVQFVFDDSLPGGPPISASRFAEINTFENTIYQKVTEGGVAGANLKASVDELSSEYMEFPIGTFDIQIDGCDMDVLWAPAWG
jgi:hypothetical protein